jgi:hypothetical protein
VRALFLDLLLAELGQSRLHNLEVTGHVLFVRRETQCVPQTDFRSHQVASLDVHDAQVVDALHVPRFNLQDSLVALKLNENVDLKIYREYLNKN